ncbi:MAG: hypothetical protein WCJ07_06435 [Verrucomicrobiota bacterium]
MAFAKYSAACPFENVRNNAAQNPTKGDDWLKVVAEKRPSKRGLIRYSKPSFEIRRGNESSGQKRNQS